MISEELKIFQNFSKLKILENFFLEIMGQNFWNFFCLCKYMRYIISENIIKFGQKFKENFFLKFLIFENFQKKFNFN